jgi:hypothetical protein
MFSRKLRCNREQRARSYARLRQLQAEGIDVDLPDSCQEICPVLITPVHQPGIVCDLDGSNTGYAIQLRIAAQTRVILTAYEISSEWDEESIELPFLREQGGRYKFGPLDYGVSEVLNDRLEKGLRFNFRGDMVEGVILAYGCETLPDKYPSFAPAPVCVTLIDSLGRSVQKELQLLVEERTPTRRQSAACAHVHAVAYLPGLISELPVSDTGDDCAERSRISELSFSANGK